MQRPSNQEIKLAILRALAQDTPPHQYKWNLIGRADSPGGRRQLESRLGISFDDGLRSLASQSFDQLRAAGLIRSTYSLNPDPENWVRITDAGLEALRTGVLDELDAVLLKINPHLLEVRRGAWSALASGQPDSLRQAAHSARELLEQVLKEGAPDGEVKEKAWFQPDKTSKNGVTPRMRLRVVMEKHRESVSNADLRIAEAACELVFVVDTTLQGLSHSRSEPQPDQVKIAVATTENALRLVLLR
jgi:predicted pPIWI-associating nuclease